MPAGTTKANSFGYVAIVDGNGSVAQGTSNSGQQASTASQSVVPASDSPPFPVDTSPHNLATSRGALVGTTATDIMPASTTRLGYSFQNQSPSANIYIRIGADATTDYTAFLLKPGDYWEPQHVGRARVSAIATAASTPLFAREW